MAGSPGNEQVPIDNADFQPWIQMAKVDQFPALLNL